MMLAFRAIAVAAVMAAVTLAQDPAPLTFEVADVQIAKPGGTPNGDFQPGGKLVITYLTLKELLVAAWDMDRWPDRVAGGPDWLNAEHYNIVAKASSASNEKDLRMMLRNLLIERFKVETHMEKRSLPVYALVPGKKLKLPQSTAGDTEKDNCKIEPAQDRKDGKPIRSLICKNTSMDFLATALPKAAPAYADLPVVNLTELPGRYDFTLGWTPVRYSRPVAGGGSASDAAGRAPAAASEPDGLTLFDALQSQLGLKLENRKHPLDVVIVDKVQRTPIEN